MGTEWFVLDDVYGLVSYCPKCLQTKTFSQKLILYPVLKVQIYFVTDQTPATQTLAFSESCNSCVRAEKCIVGITVVMRVGVRIALAEAEKHRGGT